MSPKIQKQQADATPNIKWSLRKKEERMSALDLDRFLDSTIVIVFNMAFFLRS